MQVAAWYHGTPRLKLGNFGNNWPDPWPCQFSSCCDKKCVKLSTVENLCSRESGPKFTKIAWDLPCTSTPNTAKFGRTLTTEYARYWKVGQSSLNSGSKCWSARTYAKFVTLWQEVCEISAVNSLCSLKKWTKVHQNPLGFGTHQYP